MKYITLKDYFDSESKKIVIKGTVIELVDKNHILKLKRNGVIEEYITKKTTRKK